ncbi:MAG: hypothetical protein HYT93_02185 [Parcubacteria group bacterium]|nr:hypothetical protein [Parcubacteria group bacterium]
MHSFFKTLIASAAIALFAFIGGYTMNAVASTMDETAFKQVLVNSSPYHAKWETPWASGTQDMSFALDANGNLTGKLFNLSNAGRDATLKNIVIEGNRVRFVSADTGSQFKYELNKDGTLSGTIEGTGPRGSWTASVKAVPDKH